MSIVERLRGPAPHMIGPLMDEAADEIERLTVNLGGSVAALKMCNDEIDRMQAEIERLRAALEIIAGRRQCLDNLMSNAEVARAALTHRPRDDGTVVALGGEPGASAGKSE